MRELWQIFRVIWRKGTIPECWKEAGGCFVPKEKRSETISQFRTISLLNVLVSVGKRISWYMVQKVEIQGFSGCTEHTSVISQLIKKAKTGKKNLAIVWLDLAITYGSVPHKLIESAMEQYNIPEKIQGIVRSYFGGIKILLADDITSLQRRG